MDPSPGTAGEPRPGPEARRDVLVRLRRARGQIDGIIDMIENERPCHDVVVQFAAAGRALDRAAYKLISVTVQECASGEAAEHQTPEQLERLFMMLA